MAPGRVVPGERLLVAGLPALLLAAAALLPADRPLPFEICLVHRLTGIPCLTCGLTRSICHFVQGDLAASLALHPAGALATALLLLHALWRGAAVFRGRDVGRRTLGRLTAGLGVVAVMLSVGFWLARLAGLGLDRLAAS
jgi:hypothetical protein